jgi:hypothetical protein
MRPPEDRLFRTPIEQTEFNPLLRGVGSHFVHGGVGRYQHWEDGGTDRGPALNPCSTFLQRSGVAHFDSCLGSETSVVCVHLPDAVRFRVRPSRISGSRTADRSGRLGTMVNEWQDGSR